MKNYYRLIFKILLPILTVMIYLLKYYSFLFVWFLKDIIPVEYALPLWLLVLIFLFLCCFLWFL